MLKYVSKLLCGMLLPAVLLVCSLLFFSLIARYVFNPRFFARELRGGKSSFSALWLALGGTLGVGNICGVAGAIYIGGAGCVFWIWVCGLLSAVTKYSESLLAVKYREKSKNGCTGGAPYYIKNGLGAGNLAKIFCILCIFTAFTMGNITQVKTACDFAEIALKLPTAVPALVFAVSVFALVIGKGERIRRFTSRTVPFLCVLYSLFCFVCIIKFSKKIPEVTAQIFNQAFTAQAGIGGVIGVLCSPALRMGVTRGVMSNEAGCGTAPIAYACDPEAMPIKSGLLGILEVLIDTLLLCTLTAYTVLLSDSALSENASKSILESFSGGIGKIAHLALALSVFFFALASVSAWAFYACESAKFLKIKGFNKFFAFAYAIAAFFGGFMEQSTVWALADISVSAMAVLNVCALIMLFGQVKTLTKNEFKERFILKKGK